MAEQGRYDRDYARGSAYDDDDRGRREERSRGDHDRSRSDNRRSDSLFGSGWNEREERGWGSSGVRGRDTGPSRGREPDRHEGGSSWFGDADRDERTPYTGGRGREERGGSWFGGGSDRSEHGRDRHWDRSERHRDDDHDRAKRGRVDADRDRAMRGRSDDDDDRSDRGERGFGADDQRGGLPIDETNRLIASNKVEGTAVYGLDGERLGSIYNFMVDKHSGKVDYAVMTYGGFLGMGTRYYPMPWQLLKYDTRRNGYRVDLTTRDLERAPSFDRSNEPNFDRGYDERVYGWYGLNPAR